MKKYSHETAVGLFALIGLLCIAYMTVKLGKISLFDDDCHALRARFDTVSGLRVGNPVEMFGLEIGRVSDLTLDQENQWAVVEMRIKNNIKVFDDAIASIKTAGLIGDKYISIDPGGSGAVLKNGGTITETESPTDIGDLIGKYAFSGPNGINANEGERP